MLLALGTIFLLSACGGKGPKAGADNDMSTRVPANASGVVLLQVGTLLDKADYPAFTKTELFADMLKNIEQESPALVPFVKDPTAIGMDLKGNVAFYFQPNENKGNPHIGFLIPIVDQDKLANTIAGLKKNMPEATSETRDGYTLHSFKDESYVVESEGFAAITSFNDDAKIQALLKPEGSIRDNEAYAKQMPMGKDISYWFDGDALLNSDPRTKMQLNGAASMLGLPQGSINGNQFYGGQSFEKGQAESTLDLAMNDDLRKKVELVFPKKLAVDYANYFPGDDLVAGITLGVSTSGLLEFLNENGMAMFADTYLKMAELNLGQLEQGLTGDLAAGLYPSLAAEDMPLFVAVLGLKEREFIEAQLARGAQFIQRDGQKYVFQGQPDALTGEPSKLMLYAVVKDNALVISNQSEQLDKALAGNGNKVVKDLQNGWLGLYINYEQLEKSGYKELLADGLPLSPQGANLLKDAGKYQAFSSAKIIGTVEQFKATANMKDANMNALKALLMNLNEMHKDGVLNQEAKELQDEFDDFEDAFEEELETEEDRKSVV